MGAVTAQRPAIRTPDQRLRVFVSSTLDELAEERLAVRAAIERLKLQPVMFELGARPHPPRALYRAYLEQSDIFIAIYWQRYGWVAPGMDISGLEDEWLSAGPLPRLVYLKKPAEPEEKLTAMIDQIREAGHLSYKSFSSAAELQSLVEDDLSLLLTERFTSARDLDLEEPEEHEPSEAAALPVDPTPIVGREADVAAVRKMLEIPGAALVTITGPGGIGKTRLAVETARELSDRYEVRYMPLAAIDAPDLVLSTVAEALGVRESEVTPLSVAVASALQESPSLLVLDNFEQVVDAAPAVADLLGSSNDLKILVTSRSTLRIRGENEYQLGPLDIADPGDSSAQLEHSAAVRLFLDRAREVKPDLEVGTADLRTVAAICSRVDGLPLAIELAAARVRVLSLEGLLARLDRTLGLLTGGKTDMPDRQKTLRDTIDWSYQLLDDGERMLFARLSVFVGGRTLEAAEEVCSPEGVLDVLDGVSSLLEKSLLHEETLQGAEPRFLMLETIHEFAREQLTARGELHEMQARHTSYFAALATNAAAQLRGSQQVYWIQRLSRDHDNLRAALAWADRNDPDTLLRLVSALTSFWLVQGHLREGMRWTSAALASGSGDSKLRADVLRRRGDIEWGLGQREEARKHYEEARLAYLALNDEEGVALTLRSVGRIELDEGNYEGARTIYEEALGLQRRLGLAQSSAETLNNLGLVETLLGRPEQAVGLLEESLGLFHGLDDQQGIARVSLNLAAAGRDAGRLEDAKRAGERSLKLWWDLGGIWDVADCLEQLATLAVEEKQAERAAILLGAASKLRISLGTPLAPYDAEALARFEEAAVEQLGEAAFTTAIAKGEGMPIEDAVTFGLSNA